MAQASLPLVARVTCCGFSSAVGKGAAGSWWGRWSWLVRLFWRHYRADRVFVVALTVFWVAVQRPLGSGRDDERDLWLRFMERRSGEVLSQFGRSWVRKWTQVLDYCKTYCWERSTSLIEENLEDGRGLIDMWLKILVIRLLLPCFLALSNSPSMSRLQWLIRTVGHAVLNLVDILFYWREAS